MEECNPHHHFVSSQYQVQSPAETSSVPDNVSSSRQDHLSEPLIGSVVSVSALSKYVNKALPSLRFISHRNDFTRLLTAQNQREHDGRFPDTAISHLQTSHITRDHVQTKPTESVTSLNPSSVMYPKAVEDHQDRLHPTAHHVSSGSNHGLPKGCPSSSSKILYDKASKKTHNHMTSSLNQDYMSAAQQSSTPGSLITSHTSLHTDLGPQSRYQRSNLQPTDTVIDYQLNPPAYSAPSRQPISLSTLPYQSELSTTNTQPTPKKVCPYCGLTFVMANSLKLHLRRHTGEKPFPCPHCPYKANQKTHLADHIAHRHNETRPFKCLQCSYTGKSKTALYHHCMHMHLKKYR